MPSTGSYLVFNMAKDSNNQSQLAFKVANEVTLYTRMKVSGTWTTWNSGGIDIDYDSVMASINTNINKL